MKKRSLKTGCTRAWKLFSSWWTPLCLNGTFQLAVAPTIVGLIPATGFANTARATAYQMLKL